MLLFKQMLILLLLMLVGYVAAKKDIMDSVTCEKLSSIVVNIANPALILSGGMNADIDTGQFMVVLLVAVTIFAILIPLSWLTVHALKVPAKDWGLYRCMMIFSNIGFMGFPLVQALYGEEAVLYAATFVIPFNVLIYTFGISQMSDEKGKYSIKNIFNIGVIACVVAVAITVGDINVSEIGKGVASYLGKLTSPLSMMIIGASFFRLDKKMLINDVRLNIFIIIKMLLIPVLGVILLKKCGIEGTLLGVCMVMLASPIGSMNAMISQQYKGDYMTANKAVALSSACAAVTMPIVTLFL